MAKQLAALAFVLALLVAATGDGVSLGQAPPIAGEYVPAEVLVIERPGAQTQSLAAAIPGAVEVERLPSLGLRRVKLPPQVSVEEAVRRYSVLHWVETAEPNYIVRAAVTPNDDFYGSQEWYYTLLEAPAAWDIERGDPSVVVAVLDTGVDLNHPDLDDKLEAGAAFVSNPTDSNDGPGFIDCRDPQPQNDPQDDNGHGTMVAGIVGAETDNGVGVAGTAWGVRLMPVKVLDCNGSGNTWDAAQAIDYAAAQGADIMNMSFAVPVRDSNGDCQQPQAPDSLGTAIQQAQASHGTMFVGAAGNDNCPYVAYPAAFTEVVAVGASGGSTAPDSRASFSNWGPQIDVAAPGESICSTLWDDAYACGDGTSFAAPLVSGLASLLLSMDGTLTQDLVRDTIKATATDLLDGDKANWDGSGRINMRSAVEQVPHRSFLPGISRD